MFACCLLHQVEFSPVKAHTYMEHSNSITTLRFFFYAQVIGPDSADLPPASASRALARKGCVLIAERTDHFGVRMHACAYLTGNGVQLIGNCSMQAADEQRLHELIANKTDPRRTVLIVSAGIAGAHHCARVRACSAAQCTRAVQYSACSPSVPNRTHRPWKQRPQ
jgi:hypothetical protein